MREGMGLHSDDIFVDTLRTVDPIKLREPLAETLGGLRNDDSAVEYHFVEVVKMAGHACPTTAGAYRCCEQALLALYRGQIPVRGDISITVYGEQDEGVYGVIGQVFSFITGAAPSSGFRGLGHKFRRKDLLSFASEKPDERAMTFRFQRNDNKKAVTVSLYLGKMPALPKDDGERMAHLMEKVLWDTAKDDEKHEFHRLWMERVRLILTDGTNFANWLHLEEAS